MEKNTIPLRGSAFSRLARSATLSVFTALAVSTSFAETGPFENHLRSIHNQSAIVSQDPLMRQILHRQLTRKNGGVTSVVRLATGQVIALKVVELNGQPIQGRAQAADPGKITPYGLKTHPNLIKAEKKVSVPTKKAIKAGKQVKILKEQGRTQKWSGGSRRKTRPRKTYWPRRRQRNP